MEHAGSVGTVPLVKADPPEAVLWAAHKLASSGVTSTTPAAGPGPDSLMRLAALALVSTAASREAALADVALPADRLNLGLAFAQLATLERSRPLSVARWAPTSYRKTS